MPERRRVPPELAPGLAIQFVINGDVTSIHYSPQTAADDGTNVSAGGPGTGPVAVVGAHGGQAMQAGRDAVTAGQNAAAARAEDPASKEGWWARLRKRGAVVALATIIGAIAAVVGTTVAICVWVGWTP
jgi:hypothetical protein